METAAKRVRLNVGGTIFETTQDTLTLSSGYFRAYFEYLDPSSIPEESDYIDVFIDRSPHIFKHVLSLLRDIVHYPYPRKYQHELEYFQIDCTSYDDNLTKKLDSIIDEVKKIKNGPLEKLVAPDVMVGTANQVPSTKHWACNRLNFMNYYFYFLM